MHEAAQYDHNVFVTLTYEDECLPNGEWLVPRDLELFLKRLRKWRWSLVPDDVLSRWRARVRFFASGEYGEYTGRPHYHALLFNCDFPDKVKVGKELFESEQLSKLWPYGGHRIGEVTARSANYVAQYSMKKLGSRLDCDGDGVVRPRPFLRMSRRPGIGARFVDRYSGDLRGGFLVTDGVKGPIPRAYKKRLDEDTLADIEMSQALLRGQFKSDKNDPARLAAGEIIALQRVDSHSL
jgi:hypothetical protein